MPQRGGWDNKCVLLLTPILALTERWNLGFRESKCFLRGPEILMEMNNYKISGNLVTNLIIVYLLILRHLDYTHVFCKYMTVVPELQHFTDWFHPTY